MHGLARRGERLRDRTGVVRPLLPSGAAWACDASDPRGAEDPPPGPCPGRHGTVPGVRLPRTPDAPAPSAPRARMPGAPGRCRVGGWSRPRAEPWHLPPHTREDPREQGRRAAAIAKRADVPASTVDSVIAGLQEELVDAITRGDKVTISGLLTVERSQRSARTGRNPQTGEVDRDRRRPHRQGDRRLEPQEGRQQRPGQVTPPKFLTDGKRWSPPHSRGPR